MTYGYQTCVSIKATTQNNNTVETNRKKNVRVFQTSNGQTRRYAMIKDGREWCSRTRTRPQENGLCT